MPKKFARKKAPRRGRGRKRLNRKRGQPKMDRIQTVVCRSPGSIVPDKYKCKLMYTDNLNFRFFAVGTGVNGFRYRINNARDVDPLLGSSGTIGFAQMATLYSRYRVHGAAYKMNVVNREDFPVVVGLTPLTVDPGAAITLTQAHSFIMNPYTRSKVISPQGGMDRAFLKGFISLKKLAGSTTVLFDQDYGALVTLDPVTPLFLAAYGYSMDNSVFLNGIDFMLTITLYVEFYDRQIFITS